MKTNQIMIRPMGQFQVQQRTKDGFFCASSLMKAWNESTGQQKRVQHYLDNSATKEFFNALIADDENMRNSDKPMNQVFTKTPAKTNKNGQRVAGEVWMSPLAFLDFCLWLNPTFKVKVLKFISDQMIEYRNEAGNAYKMLAVSVAKIVEKDFMRTAMSKIAEGMNYCVFGSHEKMIRNQFGDEGRMRELFHFERKVAELIAEGFLNTYEGVMDYLRKMWMKMQIPKGLKA